MPTTLALALRAASAFIAPGDGAGAAHVPLHRFHARGGLDRDAAGIEGDALADQHDRLGVRHRRRRSSASRAAAAAAPSPGRHAEQGAHAELAPSPSRRAPRTRRRGPPSPRGSARRSSRDRRCWRGSVTSSRVKSSPSSTAACAPIRSRRLVAAADDDHLARASASACGRAWCGRCRSASCAPPRRTRSAPPRRRRGRGRRDRPPAWSRPRVSSCAVSAPPTFSNKRVVVALAAAGRPAAAGARRRPRRRRSRRSSPPRARSAAPRRRARRACAPARRGPASRSAACPRPAPGWPAHRRPSGAWRRN